MSVWSGVANRRAALSCLVWLSLPFVLSGLAVLVCLVCFLPSIPVSGALVPAPTITPIYVLTPSNGEDSEVVQPFADIGVWWLIAFVVGVFSLIIVSVVGVARWRRLPRLNTEIADLEVQCRELDGKIRYAHRSLERLNRSISSIKHRRNR